MSGRSDSWRHTALLVALIGMEIAWLTPLLISLHRRSWSLSPWWFLLGLLALMLGLMSIARFLSTRRVSSPTFELIVLAVIVLIGLLLVRLYVFWEEPIFSWRWLGPAFVSNDPRRIDSFVVLATLAYLWWRSVSFLQRDIGFFSIGYDFRKGVLGLALAVSLYTVLVREVAHPAWAANAFVYLFFFCSLVAIALGRAEDKAQVSSRGQPWGPGWLGLVVAASLGMVGVVSLAHRAWSLAGLGRLGQAAAPAFLWLYDLLEPALLLLFRLLEIVFSGLVALLFFLLSPLLRLLQNNGDAMLWLQRLQNWAVEQPQTAQRSPSWLEPTFRVVLPCSLGLLVLVALAVWLQRRRAGGEYNPEQEQRTGVSGQEAQGLRQLAAAQLRNLAALVHRFGWGRRFYAALSIRHIYANLQRLAAARGFPRHQAQTPNDYLTVLETAFPGQSETLHYITAIYNAFEYGQTPTSTAELARLHAAWKEISKSVNQ